MYKCVLFDMDGTLVNTYQGIFNSYQYAFHKMNLPFPGEKFVGKSIGAPLLSVFRETCGLTDEQAAEAVKFYREYYASKGKSEADVYDGISESLKALKDNGILLGVATLKRESFAVEILNELKLQDYFDIVCGIDENDHLTKADLINKCIWKLGVSDSETILVGDSEYDADGARLAGVDFLAVLYGFGFKDPDTVHNLDSTAHTAYEVADIILKH